MSGNKSKKLFDRGYHFFSQEKWGQAVNAFDKALALDSMNAEAWTSRGISLIELGRYQEAVNSLDKSLTLAPRYVLAWSLKGWALNLLKQHQEAVESLDRALALAPEEETAWFERGDALIQLRRYQEAIECYETVLKLSPRHQGAWKGKLQGLDRLKDWLREREPSQLFIQLYELVAASEERLHLFIRQRLQQALGEDEANWWHQGVPLNIRQKCAQRREDDSRPKPLYNYTDLIDLKEIIDKKWTLFEADFQQVKASIKSKKEFLESLVRLNEIRKSVMHPVRDAPTKQDVALARQTREVIEHFVNPR